LTSATKHTSRSALEAISQTNQDRALRSLNAQLYRSPTDVHALYFRALIWSAKQDWQRSIADYELAMQLAPDDPSLRFNCGLVAWHAGELTKAEACFGEARRLDPTCEGAHYYLALVYQKQNRLPEALALAQRALELRPTECSIGVEDFIDLIDRLESFDGNQPPPAGSCA
jgi:tetratricopeptide (TPR) repeat protein